MPDVVMIHPAILGAVTAAAVLGVVIFSADLGICMATISLSSYAASVLGATAGRTALPRGYLDKVCGFLREPVPAPPDKPPEPVDL